MVAVNKLWLIKSESAAECGQTTIEMLDGEVMRLTMKRDMDWHAGQHVYVLALLAGDDSLTRSGSCRCLLSDGPRLSSILLVCATRL